MSGVVRKIPVPTTAPIVKSVASQAVRPRTSEGSTARPATSPFSTGTGSGKAKVAGLYATSCRRVSIRLVLDRRSDVLEIPRGPGVVCWLPGELRAASDL